ncbi:Unknown protein sequence [Pseudomonas savastanoi pv. glycinea]|uniref:Uncharacterized protein n=1 Tax=Pseudomonas savastanoi pv. glycinea TaxID=318 RepID=A0ABR5LCD7_PSESG|nr:Unknown protein sequence [Pseudomonas savastanoi pv. glycinea]KPC43886.1 Unknown protein sequence [Pseudomonas savastanoi pv. glycinea]KPC51745.1 Unknown protein sequence [Pseudomonas savastanoi pv. glycinea]KPX39073.1 hypothetical protein ALO37_102812 [Pseudomonas savastanoi pv. glycinea]RMQ60039.1 hypothetical protein ALQ03_103070 [Pseudomonas savastanoi pv. glycinea]
MHSIAMFNRFTLKPEHGVMVKKVVKCSFNIFLRHVRFQK